MQPRIAANELTSGNGRILIVVDVIPEKSEAIIV